MHTHNGIFDGGMHGIALGDVSVGYTSGGQTKEAMATTGSNCGSSFALQQMLADLGYPVGTVDGQIGPNTMKALRAFADAAGAPYQSNTFPKGEICQALMDAWSAARAPAPPGPDEAPRTLPTVTKVSRRSLIDMIRLDSPSPTAPPAGGGGGITGWWGAQPTTTKAAVVGGGVALILGLGYLATRK